MKSAFLALFLPFVIAGAISNTTSFAADWSDPPSIAAGSCVLVDAKSGKILHQIDADEIRPVASTQKLLTGLIIAEEGGLSSKVRIEKTDTYCEPSKLYIKAGEVYSRARLLEILLVKSMNDVARALARDNAGGQEAFAAKMNRRAKELGMTRSHFVNPNGLPAAGQHSTARDMARMALFAYRNRTLRDIVRTRYVTWTYNSGRSTTFETTNKVLRSWPLCNGMKTGYTDAAGFCLISSATDGDRHVISVILGNRKSNITSDSQRMLAWGLRKLGSRLE